MDQVIRTQLADAIPLPVIADNAQEIARLYGMTGPRAGMATVRRVFLIDLGGAIRATITYPAAIGRNIDELLRERIPKAEGVRFRRTGDSGKPPSLPLLHSR